MKTIYTSYLNKSAPWKQLGLVRVRVCRWIHNGQQERYDIVLPELYPTATQITQFGQFKTTEEWAKSYRSEILDGLNPQHTIDKLPDKCVLMCHEKSDPTGDVQCHRRLVAEWLEQGTGIHIPEWLSPDQFEKMQHDNIKHKQLTKLLQF
jgi:hypothetical protein